MNDREAIEMMQRCSEEIGMLRSRIQELAPKAEAYDSIVQILGLLPHRSRGMGEDLRRTLNRRIEELKKAMVADADPA